MKALAIDFETANEERASACAIGLAWIENGRVTRRANRLIRPRRMRFSPFNIRVHGIRPEDVRDAPEFPDVLAEFLPDIAGGLVLAHNAAFDVGVLCASLEEYGVAQPEFRFMCTLAIARRVWPGLRSHALDRVAGNFGLEFRHHDAGDDAYACAEIALHAAVETGVISLADLSRRIDLQAGRVCAAGYAPCMVGEGGSAAGALRPITQPGRRPHVRPRPALRFLVAGSTGSEYEVTACPADGRLEMSCTCRAGQVGRWCRHRTALLDGDVEHLLSDNIADMRRLAAMAAHLEVGLPHGRR